MSDLTWRPKAIGSACPPSRLHPFVPKDGGQLVLDRLGPNLVTSLRQMEVVGHQFPREGSVVIQKPVAEFDPKHVFLVSQAAQDLIDHRHLGTLRGVVFPTR